MFGSRRQEPSKPKPFPRPITGTILPIIRGNSSEDESDEEPRRAHFNLRNPLDRNQGKKKKKKHIDPHILRRAMFTLGVSLVNVNVQSCGDAGPTMKAFLFFPPVRHALYANSIADGAANYISGVVYASYTQTKAFTNSVMNGESSPLSFFAAIMGIFVQACIYGFYGFCAVPIVLIKLTTIDKEYD